MVIDQVPVRMEIDTGSGKSLIGKDIWKQSFPKKKLRETPVNLTTYSGEKLPLLGTCLVEMQHQGERHRLELLVADVTDQPPIIGRDWLSKIKIDWKGVFHIKSRTLQQVLDKHEAVFEKGLGTMKKFKAKLHLKSGATPKFVKARPVLFALRPKVEASLEKLEQEGVLEKVTHSEWGSPIVVVPKKTGGVRICGDYKVTLNQVLDVDQHPLPKPSDLFATLAGGKVLWGLRVVVPPAFRDRLLEELHEQHPGIYRMKALACSYVWWPNIDTDIEGKVKTCHDCTRVCNTPPTAPLQPWSWPTRPWQRVHIDYAEYQGKYFFVAVDAHSKWPEIFATTKTTTEKTISILRHLFSSYGFPEEIVSDNGPQFTSDQFADFLRQNGVRHTRSAPYHPATNGAAERMVQVLKKGFKLASPLSVDHQLANLLLSYRSTPHSTTGVPPAELFLKRQLRTRLTLLKPDQEAAVRRKQAQQKQQHDQNSKQMRTFRPGDHVAVLQFRGSEKWVPGIVVQALGPVAYMVNANNRIIHVHVDHLVAAPPCAPLPDTQVTKAHPNSPSRPTSLIPEVRNPAHSPNPDSPEILSPVPVPEGSTTSPVSSPAASRQGRTSDTTLVPNPQPNLAETAGVRRSTRIRKPPAKLDL